MCRMCDLKDKYLNINTELRESVYLKYMQKINLLTQDMVKELRDNAAVYPNPPSALLGMFGAAVDHLHVLANITGEAALVWMDAKSKDPGNIPITEQELNDLRNDLSQVLCQVVVKDFANELLGLTMQSSHTKTQRETNPNLN